MKSDLYKALYFLLVIHQSAFYICSVMKISIKYKRRISSVFLCTYLAFVITNAIHFHAYSLFNDPSLNNYSKSNSVSSHFLTGSVAVCAIHYFTGTILDLKFSSNNFSPFLNQRKEFKLVLNDRFTSKFFFTKNTSRAPPTFS